MCNDLIGERLDMIVMLERLILLGLVARDLSFLVLAISFLLLVYHAVFN